MRDAHDRLHSILHRAGVDTSSLSALCETPEDVIYGLSVHGSQAIALWKRLREIVTSTDHWPVLVGKDEDVGMLREEVQESYHETLKEILQAANAIEPSNWFIRKQRDVIDEVLEFGGDIYKGAPQGESTEIRDEYRGILRGPWPRQCEPSHDFIIPLDVLTHEPHAKVYIALIPTSVCWQVPGHLRFGSFNECPSPVEHAALMKFWLEQFGAEVVGITYDTVEMMVRRPPTDKIGALRLAKQQYLYCSDIVDQGTGTLEALAATLLGASAWFFWWD